MATIISSKTTGGGGASITGDTSGILQLASADGTTALTLSAAQAATFVSSVTATSLTAPILNSATTLSLQTNGSTTAVTIDASQNIGMGAVSLGARLQTNCVQSTTISSPFTTQPISLQNTDTTLNNYTSICNINSAGAANAAINFINIGQSAYPNNAGAIAFSTYAGSGAGGTEKMRIDASGNLLVGTTTAILNGFTSFVNSGTPSNGQLAVRNTNSTAGLYWKIGSTADATPYFTIYNQANVGVYIAPAGTSWTAGSDETTKENLLPITDAITSVLSLRAVIGNYISDETKTKHPFLIAQDVQKVLPEAVSISPDGKLGLAYTEVIPLLVASIKELKAIIDTQQTRITALEAK